MSNAIKRENPCKMLIELVNEDEGAMSMSVAASAIGGIVTYPDFDFLYGMHYYVTKTSRSLG